MGRSRRHQTRKPATKISEGRLLLRIIGGRYGGRQIVYSGDPVTRPMKHDVREAVFNLVGGWVPGRAAFDLFAGTGAMGLEALSRGASRVFFIERHFPTVRLLRENVQSLDPQAPVEIEAADAFFWVRQFVKSPGQHPPEPWLVFCCPPYDLFVSEEAQMLQMIESLFEAAPDDSLFVVESDRRFDPAKLPQADRWFSRQYTPALVSVYRESKGENAAPP